MFAQECLRTGPNPVCNKNECFLFLLLLCIFVAFYLSGVPFFSFYLHMPLGWGFPDTVLQFLVQGILMLRCPSYNLTDASLPVLLLDDDIHGPSGIVGSTHTRCLFETDLVIGSECTRDERESNCVVESSHVSLLRMLSCSPLYWVEGWDNLQRLGYNTRLIAW